MAIAMGWLGSLVVSFLIVFLVMLAVAGILVLLAGYIAAQADDLRRKIEEGEEEED